MRKTYFINLILYTAILVLTMFIVGCIACFFDIPSLLMVLLPTILMLLTCYRLSEMGQYFSIAFSDKKADTEEIKKGIVFFKTMQKYLLIASGIGVMMGLIAMLATLEDPEYIGKGLALALLTLLYSLYFNMIIAIPFRSSLEKKLAEQGVNS